MVAPLKVVRERPQVARLTKRSFSVGSATPGLVTADSDDETVSEDTGSACAAEDPDSGFLLLAERARQEYLKRRGTFPSCEEHLVTAAPADGVLEQRSAVLSGGEFQRMIARKAAELNHNKTAAANSELALGLRRVEAVPTSNGLHAGSTSNSTPNCHVVRTAESKANHCSSSALQKPRDRDNAGVCGSLLPGGTRISSSRDCSVLEPSRSIEPLILPPPPDFAESNGFGVSSSAPQTCELPSVLDGVLPPPPPPEFTDDRNHPDFRCRPVATWSVGDVAEWLGGLQMGCYRESFLAHSVDGRRLVELGRAELIGLGVSPVGHRMNLERAIKRAVIAVPGST